MRDSTFDPIETQPERTRLSWQRTLISVFTVAGVGTIRDLSQNEPSFAVWAGFFTVIAIIPILFRIRQLRHGEFQTVTWQPFILLVCIIGLAVAAIVSVAIRGGPTVNLDDRAPAASGPITGEVG
ncbi:MAG: DUF202 domain-containing protein [Actinobacteria bacterium]|nr:DUF202 domain-containing protein [Actinomycetota bacterium]